MKKWYKTVLKAASFLMVITVMVSLHQMQTYASETSVTALNNKHDNRNITTVNIYNAMDQLQKLHSDNIVVVDIRHPLHYKPYHLKDSKNMPLELLTLGVLSGSFDGKKIMVITDPMVDTIDSHGISTTIMETLNLLNQVVDGTNIDTLSLVQMLPDVLAQLQDTLMPIMEDYSAYVAGLAENDSQAGAIGGPSTNLSPSYAIMETLNILNQIMDGTNIDTLSMIQMMPDVLTQLQKIYLDMTVVKDKNSDKQLSILYNNIYNKWQTMIDIIPANLFFDSKF